MPMNDRSVLLSRIKTKLGSGGSLIDGIMEVQGAHAEIVKSFLSDDGYIRAKIIK